MSIFKRIIRGKESKVWSLYHREVDIRTGETVQWRLSLGTSDYELAKAKADKIIGDWKREQIARSLGIETHGETRTAELKLIIREFVDTLEGRRVTPKQRTLVGKRLCRVFELAGVSSVAELTTERLRGALARLTRLPRPRQKKKDDTPLTGRSINRYRDAVSQFYRWLKAEGRWGDNPADGIPKLREVQERPRRALSVEEFKAFMEAVPERRMLVYRVACTNGLRRSELKTLRWADVNLDDGTVTVFAKRAKARKAVTLPILEDTLEAWRRYQRDPWAVLGEPVSEEERALWQSRIDAGLALPVIPRMTTFYKDLARAEIKVDHERRLDLHALRHSFATLLHRAGVSDGDAQELMRHSDPRLTRGIYMHIDLEDRRRAAGRLDDLLSPKKQKGRPAKKGIG